MIEALQQFGFTEKEARVYLAVFSLGSAPGSTIARQAKENRITVYTILRELGKKGIVTQVIKNGVMFFSAISPEILLQMLEEKYNAFKEKVPYILAMKETNQNTAKLSFFEGEDGVKNMYNDLLSSSVPIASFLGLDMSHSKKILSYLNTVFVPQRVKKNIFAQVIVSEGILNKKYAGFDAKGQRETKIISTNGFVLNGEITLYGPDKVAISIFANETLSGMIIESPQLYTSLHSIFTLIRNTF